MNLSRETLFPTTLVHSKIEPLTKRWDDDIRVLEVGQYDFGIIMEAAEKNLMVVIAQGD